MLLLLASAVVGLVVLGALGPGRERPTRLIGPSPPETGTDGADVECRLYVSFDTSTVRSVTVGAPASVKGGSEVRIYGVVNSSGTDSVVSVRVSDPTGCASAMPAVTVPRHRP